MNRPFPGFGMLLAAGLGGSLALYLVLRWIPPGISAEPAYGAALTLSGAALAFLTAKRQKHRWTTAIYAIAVLFLFGAGAAGTTTIIFGSAAVVGWVRNSGVLSGKRLWLLAAELVSVAGTIGLAIGFYPARPITIGLCVWLFYLLQILPLAVTDRADPVCRVEALRTKFEATRHKVERILADRI